MDDALRRQHKEVIDALAQYQAEGGDEVVAEALERVLATETDRSLVTILGSHIEDALLERIISELPAGDDTRKALLKGGPLRSVEHRIALARAMDILNERNAARMNLFRAMRNACAHSRLDITLETPQLRNALALLCPPALGETVRVGTNKGTLRGLFIANATLSLLWLSGRTKDEAQALSDAATDEQGNVHADQVLLETLRGRLNSKSVPDQSPAPKGKTPPRPPKPSRT